MAGLWKGIVSRSVSITMFIAHRPLGRLACWELRNSSPRSVVPFFWGGDLHQSRRTSSPDAMRHQDGCDCLGAELPSGDDDAVRSVSSLAASLIFLTAALMQHA